MNVAGFNVNHFDIAPRYASILMGLSNGFGALAGLSGFITQHLTVNNPAGWKYCFLLAMSVDIFGIIFFLLFAKGEIQDWAREPEPEETLGEFVRRISTLVRNMSSKRRSSGSRGEGTQIDYARMEEERNNSSEMEPRKGSEREEVTLPEEQAQDPSKTTDRPVV
ncbi:hypothetical protein OSTOST_19172 [Ostertagia ostertagi]